MGHQHFVYAAASTTHNGVLFNGNQHLVLGSHFKDQRFIQWFYKAHIDQRGVQRLCDLSGFRHQGAEVENRHFFPVTFHDAFTNWQLFQRGQLNAYRVTAWVAHDRWTIVVVIAGEQHLAAFVFITRGHDDHFRDAAQEGEIERPLVGLSICANNPCPVNGEQDRQFLDGYIVQHLIVGALQEGRVNGYHRLVAANRQTGSKRHSVLLGNRHIEIAVRELT